MVGMFALLGSLSTPLASQSAFSLGFASTLGNHWQLTGGEFGLLSHIGAGPLQYAGASLRLGWFADQAAIFGGTRGFLAALSLALRTGTIGGFEVGDESNPTVVGFDLTLEGSGYLAAHSPLPEGNHWASVAALPGVRVGAPGHTRFGLMIGPAVFMGDSTKVRAFLGLRIEMPLARRGPRP
jgi:hypothetical protein